MKLHKLLFLLAVLVCHITLTAVEVDKGLVIIDKDPWKISWVQQDESTWILVANFEKGELRTYFKNNPPSKGLGLTANNQPIRQELKFYFGQSFTSKVCQFEQWPDGAKAYAFKYDDIINRAGRKYSIGTTAIIEEVNGKEDEIRYAIYPVF